MASLKIIRKRIGSVKSTQQITKAMKMVAAAKLRRAQEAATQARPYADKIGELLRTVAGRVGADSHPLLAPREVEQNIELVLVTSDRGLCGGYNTNVIRTAERAMAALKAEGKQTRLVTVGKKPTAYFRFRGYEIDDAFTGFSDEPT
jgi:F-type H+-transporting ATPase subunit gamma